MSPSSSRQPADLPGADDGAYADRIGLRCGDYRGPRQRSGGPWRNAGATLTLVPEVADLLAHRSPATLLVAAGGIADGRGLWWPRESRNWPSPASTARLRGRIKRQLEPRRANRRLESAIRSQHRRRHAGPGTFEGWAWQQDRRRLRCCRPARRLCRGARPGARTRPLAAAAETSAQGAGLGIGGHGM
jgi:hypothetical protein